MSPATPHLCWACCAIERYAPPRMLLASSRPWDLLDMCCSSSRPQGRCMLALAELRKLPLLYGQKVV
jgi:hypothetical protein